MKGKDLIKWIKENGAEDMDIVTFNDPYVGDLRDTQPEIKNENGETLVIV